MHIDSATDSLSYWHATAEPLVPNDSLPFTAEVAVIGGGMLGVWTTYWLAKAGMKPLLLEKTAIGWGASGRNGGFLTGGSAVGYQRQIDLLGAEKAREFQALTNMGEDMPHQVVAEEEIDCDLRRNGTINIVVTDEQLALAHANKDLLNSDGFAAEILDRKQLQEIIKTPLADEILGASLAPTGGLLHSARYLQGLVKAAIRHGASIARAEATQLSQHGDGLRIETTSGSIDAGHVVVAMNAWTDTLIPEMKGVIVPTRGQILAYKPSKPVFTTANGADLTPTAEYWQQTPDGSIIIGGRRADAPNKDSDVREMVSTQDVIAKIDEILPRLFPELTDLEIDRTWAGLMAFTPDGLPIVDRAVESDRIWYGGGFNGHGMPFGPILGKLLADSIADSKPGSALELFSKTRLPA